MPSGNSASATSKQIARKDKDRYLIQGYIHKDGMGVGYKAQDQLGGRTVALKTSFGVQEDFLREQFKREARLLARLEHAVLPEVYDYFLDNSGQFLLMQHIEGEDWEHLLERQRGPLALAQVLSWADKMLDALDYRHTNRQPLFEWSATGSPNLATKKLTGYEYDAATGLDYAAART